MPVSNFVNSNYNYFILTAFNSAFSFSRVATFFSRLVVAKLNFASVSCRSVVSSSSYIEIKQNAEKY